MKLDAKVLGERLRAARLEAGLTQQEVSNIIGVSPVNISKWENGWKPPGLWTLLDAIHRLGYEPSTIFPEWFEDYVKANRAASYVKAARKFEKNRKIS